MSYKKHQLVSVINGDLTNALGEVYQVDETKGVVDLIISQVLNNEPIDGVFAVQISDTQAFHV
jgi:transcription antitermination factor NusG